MLKHTLKTTTKSQLLTSAPEACFWAHSGHICCNLAELKNALEAMRDEAFTYHVNKNKNDLAKWVEEVIKDKTLAKKLRTLTKRASALRAVTAHLKKHCQY
jgi:hypothetical protein